MSDMNYMEILKILKKIHLENDKLRFGMVLQTAVDNYQTRQNIDFHDLNSKQILISLRKLLKKIKKLKENDKDVENNMKIRQKRRRLRSQLRTTY